MLTPKTLYLFAFLGFLGAIIVLTGEAQATATGWTCSQISTGGNPTGFRFIEVAASTATPGTSPLGCDLYSNRIIAEVNAGQSVSLICRERTTGPAPPLASTARNLYFQADNNNFGSPATSPLKTISNPTCDGSASATFAVFCTSDLTNTGSLRFGIIRVIVQGQSTTWGPLTSDSNGDWGIIRCNPKPTAASETVNPSPAYKPGDVPTFSFTANAASFNTGTHGNGVVKCDMATTQIGGSLTLGTTASTFSTTILGPLTSYPDDCALSGGWTITRTSGITGYLSEVYAKWDTTSPPSGVTFSGQTAYFSTGKTVDRTLTASACLTHDAGQPGHVDATRFMRGGSIHFHCTWTDVRGGNPPNNGLATGYPRRNSQAQFDTTDFNSVDFLFGTGGLAAWTASPKVTATDTNGTTALDYGTDIKTFSGVRSDAGLLFIGNVPSRFDVASTYNSTVQASKSTSPFTNATTGFNLGEDTQYAKVFNVRDAEGNPVSGVPVSCQRTKATGDLENAVSMGNTDSTGSTGTVSFQTFAPPGPWRYVCTGTLNGNSFSYSVQYLHVSTLTSNIDVVILQKVWMATNGTVYLNITAQGIYWDSVTANITPAIPDDFNVTMRVQTQRLSQVNQDLIIWQYPMTYAGTPDFLFYANVTVPTQSTWEKGFVAVRMNISAKPFVDSEQITQEVSSVGLQFNANTAERLQSMADFFAMPTTVMMPLILLLVGAMFLFSYTTNRINSIFLAMVHLLMAFAVAGTKTQLDEYGSYYAPVAIMILLGFALMTLVKGWTTPPDKDGIKGFPK